MAGHRGGSQSVNGTDCVDVSFDGRLCNHARLGALCVGRASAVSDCILPQCLRAGFSAAAFDALALCCPEDPADRIARAARGGQHRCDADVFYSAINVANCKLLNPVFRIYEM